MTTDKIENLGKIILSTKQQDLEKIKDLFGLDNCDASVVEQKPGEVLELIQQDLSTYNPDAKYLIKRFDIELTDWEIGHFSSYDDYIRKDWKIGDVTTYDWQNIKVCSANAGKNPRIIYQITGTITEKTNEFINRLKRFGSHQLELTDNSWF
jgi:hypothetical protein